MLAGEDGGHRVAATLAGHARRMGPLPWSALGPRPPIAEPPEMAGWLAGTLDGLWRELGEPDPWVVVDAGAGDGARAPAVLGQDPACAPALRWLLVEDSPGAEASQRAALQRAALQRVTSRRAGLAPVGHEGGRAGPDGPVLEDPALVLGPAVAGDDPDEAPASPPGIGPLVASLRELPGGLSVAAVVAVGWLGRLPADRFEWRAGKWWEIRLAAGRGDVLDEMLVDAGGRGPDRPASADGERVFVPVSARRWLAAARRVASAGTVLAVDLFSPDRLPLDGLGAAPRHTGALPGRLAPFIAAQWDMRD
ncbi:hypothetical protein K6U06_02445 [Acidiferrimicrobium sp. IK]|uniref:SAM-dependent methyltransferase n=1 Tax=Acidiferrimicrobium sp. IK TaxID=2871700 RepID=UPI0021CB3252|nr:SAM-dependent methyltransferase [Acidiferrimicrobium sp. IK]MCU4183205.1 hypothetical protein [Acidiferrimicrobium sp. IK]